MPSKSHPHRYQSETFQKIAEKYGLRVWISKVYSPKYLAQYMCRNLRQLNDAALSGHIDLPSGYNRVSFSQNWWKSDYLRNLAKRRAKRHTAVKVTSNDWKQLVPKLPEMSLLGDFLFIRCATSGWKCRQVHLSVVYCITMLSDEFKREIMLYRPLGYSAQKRVVAVFSTSQVMNSVQSRNSRCQNTKVSTVARVRYKYCESKHSEWTTDTYKGRKSLGGAAYHLTRPPPIPVNYQPLRNFEWGKFKSMIC